MQDTEDLYATIQRLLQEANVPGASIVILEGKAITFKKHYGVMDLSSNAPVTDDTIFRAGSISKSLTSIGIMMLVEEGKLDLNSRLKDLLPDLEFHNPWASTHAVQLRHLLEHTTGFNDISFGQYLISGDQYTVSDAVELYRPYKSRWRPGTRTSYSNAGPVIAGLIIERVSGKSFEEFMQERLFEPLEMNDSAWTKTEDIEARLSNSYQYDGQTPEPFVEIPGRPSGSLNTTAEDLAMLPLLMLGRGTLNQRVYFSEDTADKIETPQSNDAVNAGLELGYALGNNANLDGKTTFFGHDGSIDGFAATARYSLELGVGYVVMINSTSEALTTVSKAIRDYLEQEVVQQEPIAAPLPSGMAMRWTGQYQTLTPRRSFLVPLLGLSQWQGVAFENKTLRFKGKDWIHVGDGIFHAKGQSAPGLVLLDDQYGIRLQTGESTYRRVSGLEMWIKLATILAVIIGCLVGFLFALVWVPSFAFGRLKKRGGVLCRLLPTSCLFLAVSSGVLPVILFGTGSFEILGKPTVVGWIAFGLTLIAPIAILGATYTLSRGMVPKHIRFIGIAQILLACVVVIYLAYNGWFGLRIWHA